jgi:hypothetical protein
VTGMTGVGCFIIFVILICLRRVKGNRLAELDLLAFEIERFLFPKLFQKQHLSWMDFIVKMKDSSIGWMI